MEIALPLPSEPHGLKSLARTLIEQAPAAGLDTVADGSWLADPLWDAWRESLERAGMDRGRFGRVVTDYQNEVRLWLVGERLWEQCVSGLAGRAARRASVIAPADARREDGPGGTWRTALRRVDVAPDADLPALLRAIDDLQLLHDVSPDLPGRLAKPAYAIVWAGARPRDPEAPFG